MLFTALDVRLDYRFMLALFVGGIVILTRGSVLALYRVSPEVILDANRALIILGIWMVVRSPKYDPGSGHAAQRG